MIQLVQIGLVMINLGQVTYIEPVNGAFRNECHIWLDGTRLKIIEDDKNCEKTFKAIREAR